MKKVFIYYIVGFVIAVSIGFFTSENPFYGFIVAMILYTVFVGIVSVFFGTFGANPMDKSPYEIRKKEKKETEQN
ncbi:MAG: hypothetical protein GX159_04130 [Flavobacteriaceae bacterium]|nr:hypothetical protein [Flavobacteriaceae bacterium]